MTENIGFIKSFYYLKNKMKVEIKRKNFLIALQYIKHIRRKMIWNLKIRAKRIFQ